jgi:hypothetical protein
MEKRILTGIILVCSILGSNGQTIEWEGEEFEISHVKSTVVQLNGESILKVERDLESLPFEIKNLSATVDEPTFVKLKNSNIENGVVEVKVLSRIQNPSQFEGAQGFIGIAFRVNQDNTAYESIYLRPKAGRAENQSARNHTVQYYAYPDYKFDRLRNESKGEYETYADVGLDEWITMRIEFEDKKATLYLNNQKYPSFIVNELKGNSKSGSIGLWVDIATEGYFKDLKITKKQ